MKNNDVSVPETKPDRNREIPDKILFYLKKWERLADLLQWAFILLGSGGTIASILATTFAGIQNPRWHWLLMTCTIISAACMGLITTFSLGPKTADVRNAWRYLHTAVLRFKHQEEMSVKELIDSYEAAEKMLGNIEFQIASDKKPHADSDA